MSFQGVADQMYMDQFEKIQVYDLQLSLDSYVSPKKAEEAGGRKRSVPWLCSWGMRTVRNTPCFMD